MGSQLRAARALLNLTIDGLAEASGVSRRTIIRAEAQDGPPPIRAGNMIALRQTLEQAGVVFLGSEGVLKRDTS